MINVKFDQEHKSFPNGIDFTFEGDLNILVGENGSGKSHICELLVNTNLGKQFNGKSEVKIDDNLIPKKNIVFKSFSNKLSLKTSNTRLENEVLPHVCNYLTGNITEHNFSNVTEKVVKDLNLESDTEFINELKKTYPSNPSSAYKMLTEKLSGYDLYKVWQSNDFFSIENIAVIFRKYSDDLNKYILVDKKTKDTPENLTREYAETHKQPWLIFNEYFEKFGFVHRFKDDYLPADLEDVTKLKLYDKNSSEITFTFDDLSSGEKQIFSLIVAAYYFEKDKGKNNQSIRLLVLDEYDATLNPSLTDSYFKIIKECFFDNDHKVIMTSHSTDTIYSAKKNLGNKPKYYKVNKLNDENKSNSSKRIELIAESENTYASIIHKVFGVYSTDLHNELYGYILSERNLNQNCFDTFLRCQLDYVKNLSIHEHEYWKKENNTEKCDYGGKITLTTLIRHRIHHPENNNSKNRTDLNSRQDVTEVEKENKYTFDELKISTDFLIKVKESIDIEQPPSS